MSIGTNGIGTCGVGTYGVGTCGIGTYVLEPVGAPSDPIYKVAQ